MCRTRSDRTGVVEAMQQPLNLACVWFGCQFNTVYVIVLVLTCIKLHTVKGKGIYQPRTDNKDPKGE
jgi:hypothetical protein